jgi:formate dehydrogenase alpha subunit
MQTTKFLLNGQETIAKAGATILEAALANNVYIPYLCHHPDLKPVGACRLCLVEVAGRGNITACNTEVTKGMVVNTSTDEIENLRRVNVELLLANHEGNCTECSKNTQCELQKIAKYVGIDAEHLKLYNRREKPLPIDDSNPFFTLNRNKCVVCGLCIRTCQELQCIGAIDFAKRGFDTIVMPSIGKTFLDSNCESCGECVVRCPTDALAIKQCAQPTHEVKTTCPYCGCGCSILLGVRGDKVIGVRGNYEGQSNHGSLCVKGRFGYSFINHSERLTTPLIRKNGKLEPASWDEALDLITHELAKYHGDKFAFLASARCTNEDNYVMQKFTRVVMQTNNVDHCARLCHAPTVSGLMQTLGSGAMTNPIDDIGSAKCIFAIGTNTTQAHPIIALQIKKACHSGAHIIVANPREIDLWRGAEVFLQHRPGTDVALLLGIAHVIVDENLHDKKFIADRTENFEAFLANLKNFSIDDAAAITNVPKELIIKAARIYAENSPASILYAMGITQHSHGTDNVMAVSNLAVLTGNVGKPAAGVNPLRGQNNVQGACDVGALPDVYTGYQRVNDEATQQKFATAWNASLSDKPGLTHIEFLHAVDDGQIESMYIVGENPIISEADANHARKSLQKLKFLVVQDIFLTETAQLAHVVLPATTFAEKDGTFTNTERRVQRVRKAINPVGTSRADWQIICDIATKMGASGFAFKGASNIMDEIAALTPSYAGINYARLENESLVWPCPNKNHPGTPILHTERFATPSGKAKFMPLQFKPPKELPDAEFPLLLTTDRSLFQYHTATMTRRVPGLNVLREHEWVIINPVDAATLKLNDSETVKIISRRGEITAPVKITTDIQPGVIAMTFHFAESPTNELTIAELDPIAKIPETKVCAVRVEKVG